MQIRRRTIQHPRRFPGTVEQEHRGHRRDVAESGCRRSVRNRPMQVGVKRTYGRANLVFGRFHGQREDGKVVARTVAILVLVTSMLIVILVAPSVVGINTKALVLVSK